MPLEQLIDTISLPRLSYYQSFLKYKNPKDKIGAYLAFQSLSSSFFPVLQMIEVALRNSINNIAKQHYQKEEWYLNNVSSPQSKAMVKSAIDKAKRECSNSYLSDDVISRLPLGFWVYMLDKDYRNTKSHFFLWTSENKNKVFPNAKNAWGKQLSLNALFNEFQQVLKLRNRLFHHEPIWKKHNCNSVQKATQNVLKDYKFLLKVLSYLSPVKKNILKCIGIPDHLKCNCTEEYINKVISKVRNEIKNQLSGISG